MGHREFGLFKVMVTFLHGHREEHSSERGIENLRGDTFDESMETM